MFDIADSNRVISQSISKPNINIYIHQTNQYHISHIMNSIDSLPYANHFIHQNGNPVHNQRYMMNNAIPMEHNPANIQYPHPEWIAIQSQVQQCVSVSYNNLSYHDMQIQYQMNQQLLAKMMQVMKIHQYHQQQPNQQIPQLQQQTKANEAVNIPSQSLQQENENNMNKANVNNINAAIAKHPCGPLENSKFKARMCRTWEKTGFCSYAEKCQFAHGIEELNEWTQRRRILILSQQNNAQSTANNLNETSVERKDSLGTVVTLDSISSECDNVNCNKILNENDTKLRRREDSFSTETTDYTTDIESEEEPEMEGSMSDHEQNLPPPPNMSNMKTITNNSSNTNKNDQEVVQATYVIETKVNQVRYYGIHDLLTMPTLDVQDVIQKIRGGKVPC